MKRSHVEDLWPGWNECANDGLLRDDSALGDVVNEVEHNFGSFYCIREACRLACIMLVDVLPSDPFSVNLPAMEIQRDNSNRHGVLKCRGTIFARADLASI